MYTKKKFKLKLIGWKADRQTGSYPLPRVIWNLTWAIPLYVSFYIFIGCIFCASGYDEAYRCYHDIM